MKKKSRHINYQVDCKKGKKKKLVGDKKLVNERYGLGWVREGWAKKT